MDVLAPRFEKTISFLHDAIQPPAKILDLGVNNLLSERMRAENYKVYNTEDLDLDFHPDAVRSFEVDLVTAFEILEHLFNPFEVLSRIEAPRLVATIPLRLWFATAYRNPNDLLDQHFHEFEPWQFDRLLEKTGWEIVRTEKWTSRIGQIGFRPLLRRYTPRYYAVEAVKSEK